MLKIKNKCLNQKLTLNLKKNQKSASLLRTGVVKIWSCFFSLLGKKPFQHKPSFVFEQKMESNLLAIYNIKNG